jgi:formate hydrogenlyase subunit 6/NADH:ubiquinone oxidoreductase subunit I
MPEKRVEEVLGLGNYVRIEEGLSDAAAQDEVRRCLRCDICIGCGMCHHVCIAVTYKHWLTRKGDATKN